MYNFIGKGPSRWSFHPRRLPLVVILFYYDFIFLSPVAQRKSPTYISVFTALFSSTHLETSWNSFPSPNVGSHSCETVFLWWLPASQKKKSRWKSETFYEKISQPPTAIKVFVLEKRPPEKFNSYKQQQKTEQNFPSRCRRLASLFMLFSSISPPSAASVLFPRFPLLAFISGFLIFRLGLALVCCHPTDWVSKCFPRVWGRLRNCVTGWSGLKFNFYFMI